MSGSGSALFAVYRTAGEREDAKNQLGRRLGQVLEVETG
jgi:4-diphosphocytidyl-2C-methyl-D-erythritol kinase